MPSYYENVLHWIRETNGALKHKKCVTKQYRLGHALQHLYQTVLRQNAYALKQLKEIHTLTIACPITQRKKICNEAIHNNPDPAAFFLVPDLFKTQEMCNDAVDVNPWQLSDVPNYFKTQKMCDDVVLRQSYFLQFVPDWFVTQEQLEIWHDYDNDYCTNDEVIEWYKSYEKWNSQKAKTKKELLPIAWHPHPVTDWCMSEDEKQEAENLFLPT